MISRKQAVTTIATLSLLPSGSLALGEAYKFMMKCSYNPTWMKRLNWPGCPGELELVLLFTFEDDNAVFADK